MIFAVLGMRDASGVIPGCCVLNGSGVPTPPAGANVGSAPKVPGVGDERGESVLVGRGDGVGGIATAVWVCCIETWVRTMLYAWVWIAPGSSVGAGVAPSVQELKITVRMTELTNQFDLRNFIVRYLRK